jgi:predicted RNA-binding protein with TRAM domain
MYNLNFHRYIGHKRDGIQVFDLFVIFVAEDMYNEREQIS